MIDPVDDTGPGERTEPSASRAELSLRDTPSSGRTARRLASLAAAIALTVMVFQANERLVRWVVPHVLSYRAFLVAMAIGAAVATVVTRGRALLPAPRQPWPGVVEAAGRAAFWYHGLAALFIPLVVAGQHLWPDHGNTQAGGVTWAPWFQLVVRAPLWEEFVWRGLALGLLLRIVSPRWAIAASTIAFALSHFHQGYRGPGLASTLFLGTVVAIAAWRTGRLWLPVAVHALSNSHYGIAVIVAAFAVWYVSNIHRDNHWPTRRARAWHDAVRTVVGRRPASSSV